MQRRGPYKRYLQDPNIPIARTTAWARRQQELLGIEQHQENIRNDDQENDIINADDNQSDISMDSTVAVETNSDVSEVSSEPRNEWSDHEMDYEEGSSESEDEVASQQSQSSRSSNHSSGSINGSAVSNEDVEEPVAVPEEDDEIVHLQPVIGNAQANRDVRIEQQAYAHVENERDPALYQGCRLTSEESTLLIMSFLIRWGLPDKIIDDLLELIDCHLPCDLLGSKYMFLKKFPIPEEIKIWYTCPDCRLLLPQNFDDQIECACTNVLKKKKLKEKGHYFVQLSISEQIKKIMSNSSVYYQMRKYCREKDVISGLAYRSLRTAGVIGDDDLTLQWNTDGVHPFKSTKRSVWPIQACINELPFNSRRDNMILCGLYYGKSKPNINSFLKPFVEELEVLHNEGIECDIPGRSTSTLVKVHTILASVDSIARPLLQGMMQFNGAQGCSFCLSKSNRIERGKGFAMVYTQGLRQLRSEQQHINALDRLFAYNEEHAKKKKHIQGVKNSTVLLLIPVFDIISSFVPDYMHSVLEGVVPTFLNHWKDFKYKEQDWYLSKAKRDIINQRLAQILPPVEITRAVRGIDELDFMKASEMRSFLLYYSIACLKGVLHPRYFKHWFLLVYSLSIFLKEKFSQNEFLRAKRALFKFVRDIKEIYPDCDHLYTFNVHLLLHIPRAVENFGGLWASSNFPYEHFNGVLANMITGTRNVPEQICRSYLRLRQVSQIGREVFASHVECSVAGKKLYTTLLSKYRSSKYSQAFGDGLRLFGAPQNFELSLVEKTLIQQILFGDEVQDIAQSFRRFIFQGTVFHAGSFETLKVRENSTAKLKDGRFLSIEQVLLVQKVNSDLRFCVILGEQLDVLEEQLCCDRELDIRSSELFNVCHRSGRTIGGLPQSIARKCVCVPYGTNIVVTPLINYIERD